MRYAWARYRESRHDLAYRIYVSDCLRILTQNTAYQLSLTPRKDGADIPAAYVRESFFRPQEEKNNALEQETKDIVEEVLQSLGLG